MHHVYIYPGAHKMVVETVTVNPPLADAGLGKPQAPVAESAAPQASVKPTASASR
jgi:hypothetical protein